MLITRFDKHNGFTNGCSGSKWTIAVLLEGQILKVHFRSSGTDISLENTLVDF